MAPAIARLRALLRLLPVLFHDCGPIEQKLQPLLQRFVLVASPGIVYGCGSRLRSRAISTAVKRFIAPILCKIRWI